MSPKVRQFIPFLILISLLTSCLSSAPKEKKLKVATSANMQFVMKDIIKAFEKDTDIACEMIVGSSGKLSAQIINGAPYDVFVSADLFYPQALKNEKLNASDVIQYTEGKLVVWSKAKPYQVDGLGDTLISSIAIANPKTAPYGKAAQEVIQTLYGDQIKTKLVYGESISQVSQFILADQVDAGFNSIFVVNAPSNQKLGFWSEVPSNLYQPIAQGMISIKGGQENKAQQLLDFIMSDKGQEIINKYYH
ncbi:molybdate ABC transporter substrate-binding protein [Flammeovirga aprica]|uniref:Molybdate ABC transporter substrate-binding protein n=1 Tax=Flammeovirga aprica JL-4 TaxID=694437 RepID=A0A7X9S0F0_9BACT|nr:molybdate ABC transporter substrate-binding protein [Flammeovirga aprica]NME71872.1 molybdate ABC transporter substrate-binding protein [Flammeovirga aprica JL-4]